MADDFDDLDPDFVPEPEHDYDEDIVALFEVGGPALFDQGDSWA
jgi:hypothetical protein